jgi:hypothetical protein
VDNNGSHDLEILLAEFAALRAEIINRSNLQWSMFALQLTSAGVIFSFALSGSGRTGFLLIVPITSYALAGRYVSQYIGIQDLGVYIRDVLNPRLGGRLEWENWHRERSSRAAMLSLVNPLFLMFPGVAGIALIWVASYVWRGAGISLDKRVIIALVWFLGILVTGLSVQLVARIVSTHWRRERRLKLSQRSAAEESKNLSDASAADASASGETATAS